MTVVLKFGGTSVANSARIRNVAKRIAEQYAGTSERIAVVASAMAGTTDQLSRLLQEMGGAVSSEDDVILSSGEALSTALLAIALTQLGLKARSFLGWQLPILTDATPRQARILSVGTKHLTECLDRGEIPVIAGFQGVSSQNRLTTLGRGGSDTTAVAVAAALGADRCDIYTDVDGVYAADPRVVPLAHKWETVSYRAMEALAGAGAKVLQVRSVETAIRYNVPIRVLSSFTESKGTLITSCPPLSPVAIVGIASNKNICKISVPQESTQVIFRNLYELDIPFDCMDDDPSFIIETGFETTAENVLKKQGISFQKDCSLSKISVIGEEMCLETFIVNKTFEICKQHGISFEKCTSTSFRWSFLVSKSKENLTVCALYDGFSSFFKL